MDSHFTAGAMYAKRDLSAVGDQKLFEHAVFGTAYSNTRRGSPYSTGSPLLIRMRATLPEKGAGMEL